jgi:hypothetical protein
LVLFLHICLAALLLTGIWGLARYTKWLYGDEVPLVYERFPLSWAFDTMDDVGALFVVWGLVEANHELQRR